MPTHDTGTPVVVDSYVLVADRIDNPRWVHVADVRWPEILLDDSGEMLHDDNLDLLYEG